MKTELLLVKIISNPYVNSNRVYYILYDTISHKLLIYDWKSYKRLSNSK